MPGSREMKLLNAAVKIPGSRRETMRLFLYLWTLGNVHQMSKPSFKPMRKLITLLALVLMTGTSIHAQSSAYPWAIGLHGGKNEYSGDLGNAMFDWNKPFYGFGGLSLNRYLGPSFEAGLSFTHGAYGYWGGFDRHFGGRKTDASLLLAYRLNNGYILGEDSWFAPAIVAGGGMAFYSESRDKQSVIDTEGADLVFKYGARLQFRLTRRLALQYQLTSNFTSEDKRDLVVRGGNDHYLKHSVGLVISLGRGRDPVIIPEQLPLPEQPAGQPPAYQPIEVHVPPADRRPVVAPGDAFEGVLENVLFETGRFAILPEHHPMLEEVLTVLGDNPSYMLEIHGHTDDVGLPADNMILSNNRAASVKAFLVSRGVDQDRLVTKAFSEHNPVADNQTEEGRRLNRRVEFHIVIK